MKKVTISTEELLNRTIDVDIFIDDDKEYKSLEDFKEQVLDELDIYPSEATEAEVEEQLAGKFKVAKVRISRFEDNRDTNFSTYVSDLDNK